MIREKVLSDERSTAYATNIVDINTRWSDCEDCNWYKSKQIILSEARLSIQNNHWMLLSCVKDPYGGWQSNKKFSFNEELAMHMLHYQQVRYTYRVSQNKEEVGLRVILGG